MSNQRKSMVRDQAKAGQEETQTVSTRRGGNAGARLLMSAWNALLARRGIVAYLPVIATVVLLFCGASWQIFWVHTDAARYQCYALTFWQGSQGTHLLPANQCSFLYQFGMARGSVPPFHILPFEYPPLT